MTKRKAISVYYAGVLRRVCFLAHVSPTELRKGTNTTDVTDFQGRRNSSRVGVAE